MNSPFDPFVHSSSLSPDKRNGPISLGFLPLLLSSSFVVVPLLQSQVVIFSRSTLGEIVDQPQEAKVFVLVPTLPLPPLPLPPSPRALPIPPAVVRDPPSPSSTLWAGGAHFILVLASVTVGAVLVSTVKGGGGGKPPHRPNGLLVNHERDKRLLETSHRSVDEGDPPDEDPPPPPPPGPGTDEVDKAKRPPNPLSTHYSIIILAMCLVVVAVLSMAFPEKMAHVIKYIENAQFNPNGRKAQMKLRKILVRWLRITYVPSMVHTSPRLYRPPRVIQVEEPWNRQDNWILAPFVLAGLLFCCATGTLLRRVIKGANITQPVTDKLNGGVSASENPVFVRRLATGEDAEITLTVEDSAKTRTKEIARGSGVVIRTEFPCELKAEPGSCGIEALVGDAEDGGLSSRDGTLCEILKPDPVDIEVAKSLPDERMESLIEIGEKIIDVTEGANLNLKSAPIMVESPEETVSGEFCGALAPALVALENPVKDDQNMLEGRANSDSTHAITSEQSDTGLEAAIMEGAHTSWEDPPHLTPSGTIITFTIVPPPESALADEGETESPDEVVSKVNGEEIDTPLETEQKTINVVDRGYDYHPNVGLVSVEVKVPLGTLDEEPSGSLAPTLGAHGEIIADGDENGAKGNADYKATQANIPGQADNGSIAVATKAAHIPQEGLLPSKTDITPTSLLPLECTTVDKEEGRNESPDEVMWRKVNAEGKRPQTAAEVVLSAFTKPHASSSKLSALTTSDVRQAENDFNEARLCGLATRNDNSHRPQLSPSHVTSSNQPPNFDRDRLVLVKSWLNNIKQVGVQQAREGQKVDSDDYRQTMIDPSTNSEEESHRLNQARITITGRGEAVELAIDHIFLREPAKKSGRDTPAPPELGRSVCSMVDPRPYPNCPSPQYGLPPSAPGPLHEFNPQVPPFLPTLARDEALMKALLSLPFWAPNTRPPPVLRRPPTRGERRAASRAARRAATALETESSEYGYNINHSTDDVSLPLPLGEAHMVLASSWISDPNVQHVGQQAIEKKDTNNDNHQTVDPPARPEEVAHELNHAHSTVTGDPSALAPLREFNLQAPLLLPKSIPDSTLLESLQSLPFGAPNTRLAPVLRRTPTKEGKRAAKTGRRAAKRAAALLVPESPGCENETDSSVDGTSTSSHSSDCTDLSHSWMSDSVVQYDVQQATEGQDSDDEKIDLPAKLDEPSRTVNQAHSTDTGAPSMPEPLQQSSPQAPTFLPNSIADDTLRKALESLPFWAPNMAPAPVLKPPPTKGEKRAAKAARRAAALVGKDVPENRVMEEGSYRATIDPPATSEETGYGQASSAVTGEGEAVEHAVEMNALRNSVLKLMHDLSESILLEIESIFSPSTLALLQKHKSPTSAILPTPDNALENSLGVLPYWAPNTTPAPILTRPPTKAEKMAAKRERRAVKRAAALLVAGPPGYGPEINLSVDRTNFVRSWLSASSAANDGDFRGLASSSESFAPSGNGFLLSHSTPAPYRKFNSSAPLFTPSSKEIPGPISPGSSPFWTPNAIKSSPAEGEGAEKLATHSLEGGTKGNGSSLGIDPFMADPSTVGSSANSGPLFRSQMAQVEAKPRSLGSELEDTRPGLGDKGASEVCPKPLETSSALNSTAIPFIPPTRSVRVEHKAPAN